MATSRRTARLEELAGRARDELQSYRALRDRWRAELSQCVVEGAERPGGERPGGERPGVLAAYDVNQVL